MMPDEHAEEYCKRCGDDDRPIYRGVLCRRCAVVAWVSADWSHYGLTMEDVADMIEEANNNA